jgi:Arc/MetJ-type ribon-helix-helix transcriptional regulator
MALNVTLGAHGEQILDAYLRSGRYHSAEEVVTRALETLAEKEPPALQRKTTPAEAVADIRELRKGVTLGGMKIRDLISHERPRHGRTPKTD